MKNDYCAGDHAFIVESGRFIREVVIVRASGELYTLRFADGAGGVKLRGNRLHRTKEDAENSTKAKHK